MGMIPNAMTGSSPVMAQAPPDSGVGNNLRSLLQSASLLILRDGGIDEEEMAAVSEFIQILQQSMQAQTASGQGGAMQQAVQQRIKASNPQMNGEESPYGSSPGDTPYPMGG